jgi:hypothetical protein
VTPCPMCISRPRELSKPQCMLHSHPTALPSPPPHTHPTPHTHTHTPNRHTPLPYTPQDYSDALSHVHFKAEGDVEFKALLFIPARAPWDFYDNIQRPKTSGGKWMWRGGGRYLS